MELLGPPEGSQRRGEKGKEGKKREENKASRTSVRNLPKMGRENRHPGDRIHVS